MSKKGCLIYKIIAVSSRSNKRSKKRLKTSELYTFQMEYYDRMCREMTQLVKNGVLKKTDSSIAITYTWKTNGLFRVIRPFQKERFNESVAQLISESDILRIKVNPESQIVDLLESCEVNDKLDSVNNLIYTDDANIVIKLSEDHSQKTQSLKVIIPHLLFDGLSGGLLIQRFFEIYMLKTISCGCLGKQWKLESSLEHLQKRRAEQEQALSNIKANPDTTLFDDSLEVNGILSSEILPPSLKKVPDRWPTHSFKVATKDIQSIAAALSKEVGRTVSKEVTTEILSYIALSMINRGPVTTRKTFHARRKNEMRSPNYVATAKPYGFEIQRDWKLSDIFKQSKTLIKSLTKGEAASIPIEKLIEEGVLRHAPQVGLNILPKSTGNPDPPFPKLALAKYMELYLGNILGVECKGSIFLSDWYTQSNTYDVQLDVTGITDTLETEFQVSLTQNCAQATGARFEQVLQKIITAYKQNPDILFGEIKI